MEYWVIIIGAISGLFGIFFKIKKDDKPVQVNKLTGVGYLAPVFVMAAAVTGIVLQCNKNETNQNEKITLIEKNRRDSTERTKKNLIDSVRSKTTIDMLRVQSANDSLRFERTVKNFGEVFNKQTNTFRELDRMKYPFQISHIDIGIDFAVSDSSTQHYYKRLFPSPNNNFFEAIGIKDSNAVHQIYAMPGEETKGGLPLMTGPEARFGTLLANVHIIVNIFKADNKTANPDLNFRADTRVQNEIKESWSEGGRLIKTRFFDKANKHFFLTTFNLLPKIEYSAETIISFRDFNNAFIRCWIVEPVIKPRIDWIRIFSTDGKFLMIDKFERIEKSTGMVAEKKLSANNVWNKYQD